MYSGNDARGKHGGNWELSKFEDHERVVIAFLLIVFAYALLASKIV